MRVLVMRGRAAALVFACLVTACSGGGGGGGSAGGAAPDTTFVIDLDPVGGSDETATSASATSGTGTGGATETTLPRGGTLRVVGSPGVVLDPAVMYDSASWFLARGYVRQLVATVGSANPADADVLVADLATDTGTANAHYTEWTFTLREGVVFGTGPGGDVPGVTDRPITSADAKYAIERLFLPSVRAGYPFYFSGIAGSADFASCVVNGETATACGGITGIATPDDRTIVFTLTAPGPDFPLRLALPAAGPVPRDVAEVADMTGTYGDEVVATGPYVLVKESPGESLLFGRNTSWDPATDPLRTAGVDELEYLFSDDAAAATAMVAAGEADLVLAGTFSLASLGDVSADPDLAARVTLGRPACTHYLYLDTSRPPFDDLAVREGVNFALDRAGLHASLGAELAGPIATSVLPPDVPGHLSSDVYNPFATEDMAGDLTIAAERLAAAGLDGGYDGAVIVLRQPGYESLADAVAETLGAAGFGAVSLETSAEPDTGVAGFGVWCRDFQDAATFFEPLFGSVDAPYNAAHLDDAALRDAISAASSMTGTARTAAWETANRLATEAAAWVPIAWSASHTLRGPRYGNPVYNGLLGNLDWTVAAIVG